MKQQQWDHARIHMLTHSSLAPRLSKYHLVVKYVRHLLDLELSLSEFDPVVFHPYSREQRKSLQRKSKNLEVIF